MSAIASKHKTQITKEIVNSLRDVFDDMSRSAKLSSELLDANISDSFSNMVSATIDDPIGKSFEAYSTMKDVLLDMFNNLVIKYLSQNSDSIREVYKLNSNNNVLHYSILLDGDNKKVLLHFLNEYNKTAYSKQFPIYFQDIPLEIEGEFRKELKSNKNLVKVL